MATLRSKPTRQPAVRADAPADAPAARGTGLWWLWLVSNQALMGTKRPARKEPAPGDSTARSWALADLALNAIDS
jgi:hypothetical protein